MGFVFDVQKFIFSNLEIIHDYLEDGYVEKNYKNIFNILSINKTRINSSNLRILVLENFIKQREL